MSDVAERPRGTIGPSSDWVPVCAEADLQADRGAAALVEGEQVALFRTASGALYAVANRDPFSGANVLSRGLVGDIDGVTVVASPVYKQRFDLTSGCCLDDPDIVVRTWPVRSRGGVIEVRSRG